MLTEVDLFNELDLDIKRLIYSKINYIIMEEKELASPTVCLFDMEEEGALDKYHQGLSFMMPIAHSMPWWTFQYIIHYTTFKCIPLPDEKEVVRLYTSKSEYSSIDFIRKKYKFPGLEYQDVLEYVENSIKDYNQMNSTQYGYHTISKKIFITFHSVKPWEVSGSPKLGNVN